MQKLYVELNALSFCCCEACGHISPIDDIKNGLNIIGTNIFVLDVVCVLPDVDAEQWNQT